MERVIGSARSAPAGPGIVATGGAQRNPWSGNPHYPIAPAGAKERFLRPCRGGSVRVIVYHGFRFACLPAALELCNRSFPNPVAPVCKPLLWRQLRIAWNQGPKGRQNLAGGECTHEPPELISQEPEPRQGRQMLETLGQPGSFSAAPPGLVF